MWYRDKKGECERKEKGKRGKGGKGKERKTVLKFEEVKVLGHKLNKLVTISQLALSTNELVVVEFGDFVFVSLQTDDREINAHLRRNDDKVLSSHTDQRIHRYPWWYCGLLTAKK